MLEAPLWIGWSAGSGGVSWGSDGSGQPIEVEDEDTHGGRRRRRRSGTVRPKEDITREDVEKQWELLALRREAKGPIPVRDPSVPETKPPAVETTEAIPEAAEVAQALMGRLTMPHPVLPATLSQATPDPADLAEAAHARDRQARDARLRAEEETLLLLLAQM
jgi:hypothetical protein